MKANKDTSPSKPVSLGRHETNCKICQHPERSAIEEEFIAWKSPTQIAKDRGLRDRTTLYRHAWANGLMVRRRRNVRGALEGIIEQAWSVKVTAAAVVQAIVAYARINSEGRLVERSERVDINALFEKLSRKELLQYAESGKLPNWFEESVGQRNMQPATQGHSAEEKDGI